MPGAAKISISPMLAVRRGTAAMEFYKQAFGAEELFCVGDKGKSIVAQLSVCGAEFWVADEAPDFLNFSPESVDGGGFRGATVRMVVVVDDPDALFTRAVKAGAKVISLMEDKEYGWRVGRLVDPYGHHWEIGKPLS